MFFTDTHTHLYLEQFEDDIETVINDAINAVSYTHLTLPTNREV